MKIFLAYASDDAIVAEEIATKLRKRHTVFLGEDTLPAGHDYDERIRRAINDSDLFVFLLSPASVTEGRYTLTELGIAKARWPHPGGRVLGVVVKTLGAAALPPYLRAGSSVMFPDGSVATEAAHAAEQLALALEAEAREAAARVARQEAAAEATRLVEVAPRATRRRRLKLMVAMAVTAAVAATIVWRLAGKKGASSDAANAGLVDASAVASIDAAIDAAPIDAGDATPIDARSGRTDAAVPIDAQIDAPRICGWVSVDICDPVVRLDAFCPAGMKVGQLKTCSGTSVTPDDAYLAHHVVGCNCPRTGPIGGVVFSMVQCCQ